MKDEERERDKHRKRKIGRERSISPEMCQAGERKRERQMTGMQASRQARTYTGMHAGGQVVNQAGRE